MPENMPTFKEYEYPYDKIETDIVYGYIGGKNRESMLATGIKPFFTAWEEAECPVLGKYSYLAVYEWTIENRKAVSILRMKVIPVDKEGRIVQTKEQKKQHTRIVTTLNMEDEMIKAGIAIREARAKANTPNFQPEGEIVDESTAETSPSLPVFDPEEEST